MVRRSLNPEAMMMRAARPGLPDGPEGVPAVHAGHHHIEDDQIDLPGAIEQVHRLGAVAGRQGAVAQFFQHEPARGAEHLVVVHQQDGPRPARDPDRFRHPERPARSVQGSRRVKEAPTPAGFRPGSLRRGF